MIYASPVCLHRFDSRKLYARGLRASGLNERKGGHPNVTGTGAGEESLNLFEQEFMGVAQAMPADKYGFAPTAAIFATSQGVKYDGVRTFAQEISHVTTANFYFASKILGEKMPVDPKSIDSLTTKEELLKAAADSFAYAHKALATITPENAYTTIDGVDGLHTRSVIASFISAPDTTTTGRWWSICA